MLQKDKRRAHEFWRQMIELNRTGRGYNKRANEF